MIARFWPVAGVVGENGAFSFSYDHASRTMQRAFVADDAEARASNRAKLARLAERILPKFQGAAVASDQLYREADLAIDFCEDVPRLPAGAVDRIVALFEAAGAVAKVSSIHVNGWFGSYDKLTTARLFAADVLGRDLDRDAGPIPLLRRQPERRADVRLLSLCMRRRQRARLRGSRHCSARLRRGSAAAGTASSKSPTASSASGSRRHGLKGPRMAPVTIRQVRKAYGDGRGAAWHRPRHSRWAVRRPARALGLREIDPVADDRRPRSRSRRATSRSAASRSTACIRRTGTSPWCSRTTRSTPT